MAKKDKKQQTFTLSFVENISKNFSQKRESLRQARKRTSTIQTLMIINKSDRDIKKDLQSAFARVTHEAG